MSEKFQLHASHLDTVCWEEFRRKVIEREPAPKSAALIVGTSTHASVKANLSSKVASGLPIALAAATEIARDSVVSEWERGVTLDEEYQEMGAETARAEAIDTATSLSALHHRAVAPFINPVHVERPWVLDVTGLPLQLVGTIDVEEEDAILDTKTRRSSPPKDLADRSNQLTSYSLAVKKTEGREVSRVALDVLVKTKTPKHIRLESTRGSEDYRALFARIVLVSKMLHAGLFPPVASDHWKCSAKYCPFFSSCAYARRPLTVGT